MKNHDFDLSEELQTSGIETERSEHGHNPYERCTHGTVATTVNVVKTDSPPRCGRMS